ncbi:hypothetical protein CN373_12155 [Bacillus cereus]|uniref:DUF4275 family protein n=1 Tax=Bacillus cereus TaxID=1396 RepID=A0AA44TC92_BACCE|nr:MULTISPECIES: DUF4275 family protein [Bacillus cereus group]PFA21574.1 hypothetical protein CN373_12155 [Bacillus cereus]PFN09845.1 hypothetical protein COJ55_01170 [Bacillus cereus]PFO77793.1 hypothetical protein COJ77_22790 [Bacillus cereus]PFR23756.1 hypothetical protein COK19_19545 [Bacillus cereus]PFR89270.1 hypothetical protein COK38_24840 [Bacillus cereus]
MEFIDRLKSKKMKVREISKWGPYLRKRWENHFVNHLSREEKEEIFLYSDRYACGYLWHVFSWEKKQCLIGEEAERTFHEERKKTCYIFHQHSDDILILENASLLHVSDLLYETDDLYKGDIYIVDTDFSWIYVKTHETRWCGPYFSREKW